VLRLDFRGHGRSARAPGQYRSSGYVSDAAAVCEQVAGAPCFVVGHSLGGGTAAALAQRHPALVRATVLEDPPLAMPGERTGGSLMTTFGLMRNSLPRLQESGIPLDKLVEVLAASPGASGSPMGSTLHADAIETMAASLLQLDATVLDPVLQGTIEPAFDPDRPVPVPTLAIAADPASPDCVARPEDLQRLAATSPLAECRTIAGAGHLLHDELANRQRLRRRRPRVPGGPLSHAEPRRRRLRGVVFVGVRQANRRPSSGPARPRRRPRRQPSTHADDRDPTTHPTTAPTVAPTTRSSAAPPSGCVVGPPPAELDLPAFYEQWCSVRGLPIVASGEVRPEALQAAWVIIDTMLAKRPDVVPAMLEDRIRFGILGEEQLTLDMPEYADLQEVFPDVDWNTRARGLGATWARPLVSSAEENLLCLPSDRYAGESITVHEFAHTFLDHGIAKLDPGFLQRVQDAYADAMATGRWAMTYAAENAAEYWAEGVQSWFGTNLRSSPADGVHGEVDTRAALLDHDPALAAPHRRGPARRGVHPHLPGRVPDRPRAPLIRPPRNPGTWPHAPEVRQTARVTDVAAPSTSTDAQLARVEAALQQLLAANDPKTMDNIAFRGARYDAGLAWVHFPEGFGGLGVRPELNRVVERRLKEPRGAARRTRPRSSSTWPGPPSSPTGPTRSAPASCAPCSRARRSGASSSASRAPAATSPAWPPRPCVTATSGW
jgi:pimeloyl-ACP methyl ester carboxylesterase